MNTRTIGLILQGYSWDGWEFWTSPRTGVEVEDLGLVSTIENPTFSDGKCIEIILQVTQVLGDTTDSRYFRKQGCFSSYDGATWDGLFEEVQSVTKTVTAWETVK